MVAAPSAPAMAAPLRDRRTGAAAAPLAFFLIAIAFKSPWTAISSLLGQLASAHGPRSLLALNLAYFLPPMPVLAAMSALQV